MKKNTTFERHEKHKHFLQDIIYRKNNSTLKLSQSRKLIFNNIKQMAKRDTRFLIR